MGPTPLASSFRTGQLTDRDQRLLIELVRLIGIPKACSSLSRQSTELALAMVGDEINEPSRLSYWLEDALIRARQRHAT